MDFEAGEIVMEDDFGVISGRSCLVSNCKCSLKSGFENSEVPEKISTLAMPLKTFLYSDAIFFFMEYFFQGNGFS